VIVERVLYNGSIVTLAQSSRVTALAIQHGRIIATGSDDAMLALARPGTVRENLNGRFVVPGMTDAHIHWQLFSQALTAIPLYDVPSKEEAVRKVAQRAAELPAGSWIEGYGWSQDIWPGKQFPTAADLDPVSPDHPVFLRARSLHAGWANSLALRLCQIDERTPDPEGGAIARDADGQPIGILLEPSAMNLVTKRIPTLSVDQLADRMKAAQNLAHSLGMTGIHDFDDQECFSALQRLRERGELGLRVVKNVNKKYLDSLLHVGLRAGFGDDWIRIGGLKLFADGAIGPRTAYMIEAYDGEPDNYGIVVLDKEEMTELVSRASAAGLPSAIHAIGDRAVHDVLDVFEIVRREEAERGEPRSARRHRIEHVQLIHPNDVTRLAELNLVASMQPVHATADYLMADRYWGRRSAYAYNPRLQLDRGVVVAFGTDAPVETVGPIPGIHAAVTRQRPDGLPGLEGWYPEARLSVDEALCGFTTGPAYAAGMEDCLGRLAPGYLADLVVLDRDLYAIPPNELLETRVLATMVGGQWQYGGL
jgi:predicted amidohydrolase YtcJ